MERLDGATSATVIARFRATCRIAVIARPAAYGAIGGRSSPRRGAVGSSTLDRSIRAGWPLSSVALSSVALASRLPATPAEPRFGTAQKWEIAEAIAGGVATAADAVALGFVSPRRRRCLTVRSRRGRHRSLSRSPTARWICSRAGPEPVSAAAMALADHIAAPAPRGLLQVPDMTDAS